MTSERSTLIVGAVLVVVALLAVAWIAVTPASATRQLDAVEDDVGALRRALLDHVDAFGHPVAAAAAPRAPGDLTAEPVPWSASDGFRVLAWAPTDREAVFASYSVAIDDDDFVITARCDLDGDGVLAEFQASRGERVTRRTPVGVR